MEVDARALLSVFVLSLATLAFYLYSTLWLKPEKFRRELRRQGIDGPVPSFLLGNIPEMKRAKREAPQASPGQDGLVHDYASTFFPYFDSWRKKYGKVFMFSIGSSVSVYVSEPDLVKEICLNKSLDIGKTTLANQSFHALFGKGIIAASGQAWAVQRKIIAPELFMDKVKGMVDLMAESAAPLLNAWESKIRAGGGVADIQVDTDFQSFAADVLSRACFGSNYSDGEEIFSKITTLLAAIPMESMVSKLPGSRYLPTKSNRLIQTLEREIGWLIRRVVKERKEKADRENDLLQSILKSSVGESTDESFIVDNCKNIYFAGQDTISIAARWVLVLLAANPEWQRSVREEVMEVCGEGKPDFEKIKKLTLLTQVIQETLRLYPASPVLARQLYGDIKIGNLHLRKGTGLWIPTLFFHHSTDIWGADANQFKPERFAKGVTGASKHPHLYIPFGLGPRTCVGQNFAMVELKIVLAMILSRFKVSPSPQHRHAVDLKITLGPKYGVHLVIEKV